MTDIDPAPGTPRHDGAAAPDPARARALARGRRRRADVRIVPHDVILLASDIPVANPRPDHVAAAHLPSQALAGSPSAGIDKALPVIPTGLKNNQSPTRPPCSTR